MKIRKIEVKDIDTEELEPAQQLICDCGSQDFIVYSLADGHTHLQCSQCDKVHCSNHPPEIKAEEYGFSE